jgi:HPt (histidine-containing phosphotransfer) domain-containing protein
MTEQEQLTTTTSLNDTGLLREFLTLIGPEGPELLRAIVETYVTEARSVVERLGDALARADHAAAAWLAHRLKGRFLGIGARQLAARCAAMEQACRTATPPPRADYVAIRAGVTDTTHTLRIFLAQLA